MTKARQAGPLFGALLLVWILLHGSLQWQVVVVGVVVAAIIALLFSGAATPLHGFRRTQAGLRAAFGYLGYFFVELVRANLKLAVIILSPSLPIRPGIVKVRTRLTNPVARLLLANSITLTPGTLSVALEGEWLYVHWVTVVSDEVEEATAEIVAGFERYLEVMYG